MVSSTPLGALQRVANEIDERKTSRPAGSTVVALLNAGPEVIGARLVEEVYDLVHAASEPEADRMDLTHHAADVLLHLLVLLSSQGVDVKTVERELLSRFGISP
ncbi:MAG: phosphoribosyl-ATP diphosphatase [Planctomycetaceae bacterium]|nr:phosphoribosyl-ATP diphosphatase [Planctomycetaceae bacterium]